MLTQSIKPNGWPDSANIGHENESKQGETMQMKITIDAAEIERFRAAHPGHRLNGLTSVSFEFDAHGNVLDCQAVATDARHPRLFAGSGLSALHQIACQRFDAQRPRVQE